MVAELVGELVGAVFEGLVVEVLVAVGDCGGVGGACGLGADQFVEAVLVGVGGGGVVVVVQELVAFWGGEEGEGSDWLVGVGERGLEEGLVVAEEALDGGGVEQVGAVAGGQGESVVGFGDGELEVEAHGGVLEFDRLACTPVRFREWLFRCSTAKVTCTMGLWLRLRSGASMSTSSSKGRFWWA